MDKESLISLINKTKQNIKAFEEKIFKERTAEYSIYRAETAIYLDNLKFIEKLLDYSLNATEIESIVTNLNEMNEIIEKDYEVTISNQETVEPKIETPVETNTYNTANDFNSINFDSIAQEVNNTQQDYSSVQQFIA
jgi:hypothetical protein